MHANIDVPEFLKVGIVIRQTEEGPMRTHLIMNAHRLTTFPDIRAEVTNVKQAQRAVMTKVWRRDRCGLVLEGIAQRSFQKYWKQQRLRGRVRVLRKERPLSARVPQETERCRQGKIERCEEKAMAKAPEKARNGSKANVLEGEKSGHMSKDCTSKETNAFEADDEEPLSEPGCFDMASIKFNALEIGSVQASEGNRKLSSGIDSRAAVTVFPKTVAEDYTVRKRPGKAKSYRPASGKLVPDLGARKGAGQTPRKVFSMRQPASGRHAQSSDGCVGDERHGSRCALSQERQRYQSVRVPRGQWHEAGARKSECCIRVAS